MHERARRQGAYGDYAWAGSITLNLRGIFAHITILVILALSPTAARMIIGGFRREAQRDQANLI